MKIEAYIIAFNESETIHLTIKHYKKLGAIVKIFDNYSTDNTVEICKSMGCEVESFGIKGELNDSQYRKLKNYKWKESQADWVIVCDADEILDVSLDTLELTTKSGNTIFKTNGYNAYSNDMPVENFEEIKTFIPDNNYSKLIIFDPKAITDMMYEFGCHKANPCGKVVYSDVELSLFHYRAIGGADRMAKRHALYRSRMGEFNKRLNLGSHYLYDDERRIKEWHESYEKSVIYSQGGF